MVITGASLFGAPVSTTHTITACIFGVGSTKRLSAVRWEIAANLAVAWVITIPAAGTIAGLSYLLLESLQPVRPIRIHLKENGEQRNDVL